MIPNLNAYVLVCYILMNKLLIIIEIFNVRYIVTFKLHYYHLPQHGDLIFFLIMH